MDHQGYKHFSHMHNLIMHQMPEGAQASCSGCNSSDASGTVFVCWPCNFFLHEQCYRATRSLNHPSHPPHPLTLVPYPTYPSNSFYCNSCEIIGTGFSYSCANCDFDLHVQCAFSISGFRTPHNHQYPMNYYNSPPSHQELGQNNINMAYDAPFVSVPPYGFSNIPTDAHVPYVAPSAHSVNISIPNPVNGEKYHSQDHLAYVSNSVPPGRQNSNGQELFRVQNGPSVSVPNPVTAGQDVAYVSNSIPPGRHNSVTNAQEPSRVQNGPISDPVSFQNPVTRVQYPSLDQDVVASASVSIPTKTQSPISTSTQDSNMGQKIASISIPNDQPIQPESRVEYGQNQSSDKGIVHFSHPHDLFIVDLKDKDKDKEDEDEDEVVCSGCEENITGKGYSCVEPKCDFRLHESCFRLKKEIQHNSHPEHPLTLLSVAPYDNENGEFTCNACFSDGTGFTYHCSVCKFDLHVQCVSLPETVERKDHEHVLKLFYLCPKNGEEEFSCDVCHGAVQKDRWAYYCESCNYCTHLGCVDCEECEGDSVLDMQMQLQRLQFQVEMTRQQAQMVANMGASLLSLV